MDIKRIIVSRTDKIGDLILSIPSFFMIKKMYPNAELVVLVRKYNYEIVKNLPYIDRIMKIDEYSQSELIEKIAYFKADVFIALYNDSFVAKIARASRAKIKIGPISKLSSIFTYNKGVWQKRSKSIKNEGKYNLDLVKKLDKELYQKVYELNTKMNYEEKHRNAAELFFKMNDIKGQALVVNPFIGGSAKNIKDEEYASLIMNFKRRNPEITVIITCHISEEERGEKLVKDSLEKGVYLYANGGELLNIAAIIDRADVYLGASTGPTHIAGALKKRIVAIYPAKKTQSLTRWGILGNDKVFYLIPDQNNPSEDYNNPYFDKYDKNMELELILALERALKLEEGGKN